MGRELYQLVAIDKSNNEYVIELKNENKNNKGELEFIDSGTVRFADEHNLAEYLYKNGKIPTKDVTFFIKYKHNGDKYLPVIYNDRDLYVYLGFNDAGKYDYILRFFRLMEIEFSKQYFYNYFVSENKNNNVQSKSGHCLNNKLFIDLINYNETYIKTRNYDSDKIQLQYSILSELFNYKQFRTMYQFHKTYVENSKVKSPNLDVVGLDDLESKGIRFK